MAQKGKRLARYESQASKKCITLSASKKINPAIPKVLEHIYLLPSKHYGGE